MMNAKIFCAVVGETTVFPVEIDENASVSALKEAIKGRKASIKCDADLLQLYLTKKKKDSSAWLLTENQVEKGETHADNFIELRVFMKLSAGTKLKFTGLSATSVTRTDKEEEKAAEGEGPVHVLVVVPQRRPGDDVEVAQEEVNSLKISGDIVGEDTKNQIYADPYRLVSKNLKNETDYVMTVVKRFKTIEPLGFPFIVLESSSGMGKTQMAFNLMARDDVDVFCIVCKAGAELPSQNVYSAFGLRSANVEICVDTDLPLVGDGAVDSISSKGSLLTYGFIWALLSGLDAYSGKRSRADVEMARGERKKRTGKEWCLIFLDEFPLLGEEETSTKVSRLRFIRDVFRSFELPVI